MEVGWLRCRRCGAVAWPTDAAHVTARWLLARYVLTGCRCTDGDVAQVWLIDVEARGEPVGPWCGAFTSDGEPCRGRRRHGEATCWAHRLADRGGEADY